MKKIISMLALCIAAVLILCGCGAEDGNRKIRIGVSIPAPTHGWASGVVWNANELKKKLEAEYPDCEIIVVTAENSTAQVEGVESLLLKDVDALVIMAQNPIPLTAVCKRAKREGKFVAIVSNPISDPVQDVFVNGDNRSFGVEAARALGNELKGKGDIVYLTGIPGPIDNERTRGFLDTLRAEYPGIRIQGAAVSEWSMSKGQNEMEGLLLKFPHIDGVWAGDDDVLLGVLKAYRKSGRSDVKAFVGGGAAQSVVRMIAEGDPLVKATVTYPPDMICVGINAAMDFLKNGKTPEKEIIIYSQIVTGTNAKDFIREGSPY